MLPGKSQYLQDRPYRLPDKQSRCFIHLRYIIRNELIEAKKHSRNQSAFPFTDHHFQVNNATINLKGDAP
jgi:hypothetical protein